jgi:hypothetical protein
MAQALFFSLVVWAIFSLIGLYVFYHVVKLAVKHGIDESDLSDRFQRSISEKRSDPADSDRHEIINKW